MGPCVSEKQRETVAKYVEIGKAEGAKLADAAARSSTSGRARARAGSTRRRSSPTPNAKMRVACEEIFGPVTTVVPIASLEEGIRVANSVAYGLSGSIYTQDVNKAFTAMRDFETGIFYVNSSTIGAEVHLPVRRHQGHGQRPPRGGHRRPRRLHRVEVDLRRLLGQAPEGADRHAREKFECSS